MGRENILSIATKEEGRNTGERKDKETQLHKKLKTGGMCKRNMYWEGEALTTYSQN